MAVATYNTDLNLLSTCEAIGTWDESSDAGWDDGGGPAVNADLAIEQSNCVAQILKTGIGSMIFDYASDTVMVTGEVFIAWHYYMAPNALADYSAGGIRALIGSSMGDFYSWDVGGADLYEYGGWLCIPVDPDVTPDDTVGTPSATIQDHFGGACNVTGSVTKGSPHCMDVLRWGRGQLYVELGDTGAGTFTGMAAANDGTSARWGLFQSIAGGYLWQGLMSLGTTSAVTFTDSNKAITVNNPLKVTSTFNKIEINHADSVVTWTSIHFRAVSGAVSSGALEVTANANVDMDGCSFTNMGAFTMGGTNSEWLNSIWSGCGLITAAGGKLNGSKVLTSSVATNASAVNWNVAVDPDGYLDNMEFSKGTNEHHAIEFGTTSPTTMTLTGIDFTGFGAEAADGAALYVARTTSTVTINLSGCSGTINYKSAGATVVLISDPVLFKVITATADGTGVNGVQVWAGASDGTGTFPYLDAVTIVNAGTLATVTYTGHAMATGDKVLIKSASLTANNGVFTITFISSTSYSYVMGSTPGSSPTGATCTFTALYGLTANDAGDDGVIKLSRVFPTDQPITGNARKYADSYKTAPIVGTVDSVDGLTVTAIMIPET